MPLKYVSAKIVEDATLGERQVRVVANSGQPDRVGDILVAKGCLLKNYASNPIVLADHDPTKPIGNFAAEITECVEGVVTFAPQGISAKADEYCGLAKAGILRTVSVGFNALEFTPNKATGGVTYSKWELMELSFVGVPCDPNAVVTARSFHEKAEDSEVWKVGASRNLPIGGDDAWDGPAAEASIFEKAGFDGDSPDLSLARKGFLVYDSANPKLKGSYKLPFAKVVDGRLTAMPAGIRAAASRLPQADLADDVAKKARMVLDDYEARLTSDDAKAALVAGSKGKPKLKGLYEVAQLAYALAQLGWIHDTSKWEEEAEGDSGSKLPGMLAAILQQVAEALNAMTVEETAELLAGCDIEPLPADEAYVLAAATPQAKALRTAFRKAGRALSQKNRDHVEKCMKAIGALADCHVKAADLKDDLHDTLLEMQQHIETAGEHAKAVSEADGGADRSGGLADDENSDLELAGAIGRRKRMLDVMALATAS